ncbi:MAG: chorismate synthase, partial [Alistipes sp.]|nr:chorismate synthase [Alistipes sp.]
MRYTLFGESHGPAIGVTLTGLPSGLELDMEFIRREMQRRAPGASALSTPRREPDAVRIVSGVFHNKTTGTPLCALIENQDTRSADYERSQNLPRPGHADYTGHVRYQGYNDFRGGGHFSGRLTAPMVFAGALAKLVLARQGLVIAAHIRDIAGIPDTETDAAEPDVAALRQVAGKPFPVLDNAQGRRMQEAILAAKADGDSVGGSIRCYVLGLRPGLGGPDLDESLEGILARHLFAVPAVKGIEFGDGFGLAALRGSQANDPFHMSPDGSIRTRTNRNGGINGGISNGMPLVFAVVIKPTPSIALPQQSVDLTSGLK